MRSVVRSAVMIVAVAGLCQVVWANGVSIPSAPSGGAATPSRPATPEEMAVEAYNSGIARRDRAAKAEAQAFKDKKASDRAKNEKKAREEYEKALKDFEKAMKLNPAMPQAYNGMGFSYRKLGDYDKALTYYDKALELAPRFLDAIEYRAEAYLALNRIDDAKQAYLTLFGMDRKQADSLMAAMKEYVAKKKADPAGVDAATLAAFESWIAERSGVAEQTKLLALNVKHLPWR
jgi:tetratricopeptide (TPR) repeat protein